MAEALLRLATPPVARERPRSLLFAGVGIASIAILGIAHFELGRSGIVPALIVTFLLAASAAWAFGLQLGVVILLAVTVAVDRYSVHAGPLSVRSEQLAAFLGLGVVVWLGLRRQPDRSRLLIPTVAEVALLIWFGLNLVVSAFESPHPGESLKITALMAISALGLALPARLLQGRRQVELAVNAMLWVGAAAAAFGIVSYALYEFGIPIGASINPATGKFAAFGTLWEPNALGTVCVESAVAWTLLGRMFNSASIASFATGISVAGAVASVTRAAWLVLALMVVVIFLLPPLRARVTLRFVVMAVAAALVLSAFVVALPSAHARLAASNGSIVPARTAQQLNPPDASGDLAPLPGADYNPSATSTSNLPVAGTASGWQKVVANSIDVVGRIGQLRQVQADSGSRWLFGGGTASYGQRHQYLGQELWIASLPLRVFNDTGLLGLGVFLVFGLLWAREMWRARTEPIVMALATVAAVLVLTSLSTESLELMIGWFLLGLGAAAARLQSITG